MAERTCSICKHIPDQLDVETMHTDERLPSQVDKLTTLGGGATHGYGQVRVCPKCGEFYSYLYDHDSESGLGNGYTDEGIRRITRTQAQERLVDAIRILGDMVDRQAAQLKQEERKIVQDMYRRDMKEDAKRLEDLKKQFKKIFGEVVDQQ